jgi:NDP-sugar pyrophosphorylase family protein
MERRSFDMQAIILAAGRGERMGQLGQRIPKPLLYLPGGRLVDRLIDQLCSIGIDKVDVVVSGHSSAVARYLAERRDVGLLEQHEPWTIGQAVATGLRLTSRRSLIIHGDNIFSRPLDYFLDSAAATPAAFLTEAEGVGLAGCYILSRNVLELGGEMTGCDELGRLRDRLDAQAAEYATIGLQGWRENINRPGDYLRAFRRLLDDRHPGSAPSPPYGGCGLRSQPRIRGPSWVSPYARLVGCEIGPYVVVGEGAIVESSKMSDAVVFPGAVARGIEVSRAVILGETVIPLVP